MGLPFTALLLAATLAQPSNVRVGRVVTLTLPHLLREGETASLEVKVEVLTRGQVIVIATTDGRLLGHISLFGTSAAKEARVYPVPLPPDAILGRRVSLRLTLQEGDKQRAPTKNEVKEVRVRIMPAAPRK